MSRRVTEKRLQQLVYRVVELQGRPVTGSSGHGETQKANVGSIHLDHASCYGGWDLVEITSDRGSEESLVGNTFGGRGRLSSHEMETFLLGMLAVLDRPANH
jgi:hypothetical protein